MAALGAMTRDRKRQVWSWLLIAVVAILCSFNDAFFAGFFLFFLLRPDLQSETMSDVIESKYRKIAIFGACYAAMVGTALLILTLLMHEPVASWIGLSIIFISFWPFVLILALNEYRLFTEGPNTYEASSSQ
jgi:hypothetical protein